MEKRTLGSLAVSVVGLGCSELGLSCDERRTREVVRRAIACGITFVDTADSYGKDRSGLSEIYLGKALRGLRDDVVVATKFGSEFGSDKRPDRRGAGRKWILRAIDGSLTRLGTDRIDLYQLHVPDPSVSVEETLEALDALVRAGKVVEIGCSNFDRALIE